MKALRIKQKSLWIMLITLWVSMGIISYSNTYKYMFRVENISLKGYDFKFNYDVDTVNKIDLKMASNFEKEDNFIAIKKCEKGQIRVLGVFVGKKAVNYSGEVLWITYESKEKNPFILAPESMAVKEDLGVIPVKEHSSFEIIEKTEIKKETKKEKDKKEKGIAEDINRVESYPIENIIFQDIKNHWAKEYIQYLKERKIITGYEDHTFRPEKIITRGEFFKIFCRALSFIPIDTKIAYTEDIPPWVYEEVKTLQAYGVIKGYEDGTLRIEDSMTKAEGVAMIGRILEVKEKEINLKEEVPPWCKEEVLKCIQKGILQKDRSGKLHLNQPLKRGEAAKMIYEVMHLQ